MIDFLNLLFPSALGTIAKSSSESRAKFSSSRRPSGENTGGPQGLELTPAWLMAGLRLRPKSSKQTLFSSFLLALLASFFTHALKTYATTLNTNTWMVSLVGKWSLFCLLKEIFQCRSLAKAVFFPLLLAPPSFWLFFSFMTNTHTQTHFSLIWHFVFLPAVLFSLLLTTVSSSYFSHIYCLLPIYNSHRMRPFSPLPLTAWTYVY